MCISLSIGISICTATCISISLSFSISINNSISMCISININSSINNESSSSSSGSRSSSGGSSSSSEVVAVVAAGVVRIVSKTLVILIQYLRQIKLWVGCPCPGSNGAWECCWLSPFRTRMYGEVFRVLKPVTALVDEVSLRVQLQHV